MQEARKLPTEEQKRLAYVALVDLLNSRHDEYRAFMNNGEVCFKPMDEGGEPMAA